MKITIEKKERRLAVFDGDQVIAVFAVAFGFEPSGAKQLEGDGKTPEGEYIVCVKNPKSKFHLSLGLNYPNIQDAERGLAAAVIPKDHYDAIVAAVRSHKLPPQDTGLGGEIYIHGGGTDGDWTRGCIALADDEMTRLFRMIDIGTPVIIS